jgi:hypothetical protein
VLIAATLIGGIVIGAMLTSRSGGEAPRETPVVAPVTPPIERGSTTVVLPPVSVIPTVTPSIGARQRSGSGARPNGGSAAAPSRPVVSHAQKLSGSGSAASAALNDSWLPSPLDAGVDAAIVELPDAAPPQRSSKPPTMDRNQTVNPFAPKRHKVSP